ncbi:MAG: gamma-glutamylcyclotransferase [Rhodobacteraceae bacterium]|nr:gamma-glutamylcyclotransferase [Paracoccaceae bacterium]
MAQHFFGYGSLVNRTTHGYGRAHRASVTGWRRMWRHTAGHPYAVLTAHPAPGARIEGLVAEVPGGDWAALDAREAGYRRHPLAPPDLAHEAPHPVAAQIYAVPPEAEAPLTRPVLLSYLDVVLQGYLREFGPAGAERFMATTDGWSAPVLNDRARPRYPRHRTLTGDEAATVDALLASVAARVLPAD